LLYFNPKANNANIFNSDCSVPHYQRHLRDSVGKSGLPAGQGLTMDDLHELMLERMQMLEAALRRAVDGVATQDDWDMICTECGVPNASIFKPRSDK
jgi:hypothetical protein